MAIDNPSIYHGNISGSGGRTGNNLVFIDYTSLEHVGGPPIEPPTMDLLARLDENPDIRRRLPAGTRLVFKIRKDRKNKSGFAVYDAHPV